MFTANQMRIFELGLSLKDMTEEESSRLQNLLRNLYAEMMKETWQRDWALVEMEDSEYV